MNTGFPIVHMFRYFIALLISCIITLSLFLVIQKVLNFDRQRVVMPPPVNSVDFVRLIREPEQADQRQQIPLPETPKPPEKKSLPSKVYKVQLTAPTVSAIEFSVPRLQNRLNLKDALYLGDFHREQPVQQVIAMDEEVIPLVRIAPVYPSRAARLGIEGWVKMEVEIDSKGTVSSVRVVESKPTNIFDRAAIKAIKKWRFRPKIVAGKAVSRTAEQQINFKLNK